MPPLCSSMPVLQGCRAGPVPTASRLLLAAALFWSAHVVHAQPAAPTASRPVPAASAPAKPRGPASKAIPASAPAAVKPAEAKPTWSELTPPQQQALAPLSGTWADLSEAHKRKWLALSQNFPKLPAAEQVTLHSRMKEWAALSPKQRVLARLNFGETKRISPDDKKAKWEAYQSLSEEEKRKLAADAAAKPPTTAAAIKPVPKQKLATVPKPGQEAKAPRIAASLQPEPGQPAGGRPAVPPPAPN